MRIEEVAEDILWINPDVSGSGIIFSSYLVRGETNVLIEPGPAAAVPSLLEALDCLGLRSLDSIIPTHIHMDHAGGLGDLAAIFPEARVLVHPRALRHVVRPARLIESTRSVYGLDFERVYGPIRPVPQRQLREVSDGESVPADGRSLEILHAPGHAPHHILVYDPFTQGIFCGEALGMGTDVPLPAPSGPSFNLEAYLSTMERALALAPRYLFYSHGSAHPEAAARIQMAMQTTQTFAERVRDAMKQHVSRAELGRMIRTHAREHFPPEWREEMINVWLAGMLDGYACYFTEKGFLR